MDPLFKTINTILREEPDIEAPQQPEQLAEKAPDYDPLTDPDGLRESQKAVSEESIEEEGLEEEKKLLINLTVAQKLKSALNKTKDFEANFRNSDLDNNSNNFKMTVKYKKHTFDVTFTEK